MSLLVSCVFGDKVEVFASNDESAMHFCRDNGACKDTATDRDHAGKRTFLVCDTADQ